MAKEAFIEKYRAARAAFLAAIEGLEEPQASQASGATGEFETIKDLIGHVAAWEREVLIADEMIKRGEQSYLENIAIEDFNQAQAEHRREWPLAQLRAELDLNYEALLMAWDEYEGDEGPSGPATWQPGAPGSLYWLINHQREHGAEIARRRNRAVEFPE